MSGNSRSVASLGMVPSWEPGETLYGWAAKTHLLLGRSAMWSARMLFGSPRACRAHAFPAHIPHLSRVVNGRLGRFEDVLRERTILGAYLPFLDRARRPALVASVLARDDARPQIALGLAASGAPVATPLRFCEACRFRDLTALGYPRWQVVHQLPGVWICPEHLELLVQLPRAGVAWEMPGDRPGETPVPIRPSELPALQRVAAVSTAAAGMQEIDVEGLRSASIRRLNELGMVAAPRRLSEAWLRRAIDGDVGRWLEARTNCQASGGLADWVASLYRRRSRHPLKWAIAWSWLWQDEAPEVAARAFRDAAAGRPAYAGQSEFWPTEDAAAQSCFARVADAMADAESMSDVLTRIGVGKRVLDRWFTQFPELRTTWQTRLFDKRRSRAINNLHERVRDVTITRQRLMDECSTDIRWLQRNDRMSLGDILARVPQSRGPQRQLFGR